MNVSLNKTTLVDNAIKLVIKSFNSYENETVDAYNNENNSIYTINNVPIVSFPTSLENLEKNLNVVSANPELKDLRQLILLVLNKILLNQNNILKEIETDIHNYQFRSINNPNKRSRYESKYLKYKNKYLKLKKLIQLD